MAGTRRDRNPGQGQRSLPLPTDSSEAEGPAQGPVHGHGPPPIGTGNCSLLQPPAALLP